MTIPAGALASLHVWNLDKLIRQFERHLPDWNISTESYDTIVTYCISARQEFNRIKLESILKGISISKHQEYGTVSHTFYNWRTAAQLLDTILTHPQWKERFSDQRMQILRN